MNSSSGRSTVCRYLFPDPPVESLFEDGQSLAFYRERERTCADIAKFSQTGRRRVPKVIRTGRRLAADDRLDLVFGTHGHG